MTARAFYHRLELQAAGGPATVTVRFFSAAGKGPLRIKGMPGGPRKIDAAALRKTGLAVALPAGKRVALTVAGAGDQDLLGPFVDITAPRWKPSDQHNWHKGYYGLWEPIKGTYTFRAAAADRSGVARVEFYLNNGRLIGTDTKPPYECRYRIRDTFCQYVYAIAYDTLGNKRRSFVVPFGDGSVGPSLMK